MTKCNNCLININNNSGESIDWSLHVEQHKHLFNDEQKKKFLDWENKKAEEEKRIEEQKKRGYYSSYGYSYSEYIDKENPHAVQTRSYCGDCAKALKKFEIARRKMNPLEPELESLKTGILDLKNAITSLTSTIQSKDDKIIELLEKNNQLLEENTKIKQELLVKEVKETTKTYCIIEQQSKR